MDWAQFDRDDCAVLQNSLSSMLDRKSGGRWSWREVRLNGRYNRARGRLPPPTCSPAACWRQQRRLTVRGDMATLAAERRRRLTAAMAEAGIGHMVLYGNAWQ